MDLLREFKVTNMDKTIMYSEWQKISQEITRSAKACSERNTKVTKKVTVQEKVSILFIYLFIYLFKVNNDKKDTVYKNAYKIAWG